MKTVPLIVVFLLAQLSVFSQEKTPAELKELFYDAEFFFAQEEYPDALYDYLEIYNNGYKENANINYRIGICYLNIPAQKEKSVSYLLEAVKNVSAKYNQTSFKQQSAPYDAYLFLGNAYRVNNKLNEAIGAYNKFKELAGTAEEIKYADQQITACNTGLKFIENPRNIKLTNLGDSVNTSSSNFKAVISGDGRTLVYMNELPFYDAVYFCRNNGQGWSSPINITPQIQSDGDQYVSSISFDGARLMLTREDAFNSDLYVSNYSNGAWSKSLPLNGQEINTKFWESHASVSRDGKTMYFTSNRKDGVGDMDIYVSKAGLDGQWGTPRNLGPVVNTPLNEDTPFITENDSMLFFSSQGHENIGGYDIFVSRLDATGQWTTPENLKYPVNTTDDDLFFYPWNNARIGFLSRIMDNGYGKEDIYALQPYDDEELDVVMADFFRLQEPTEITLSEIAVPDKSAEKDVAKPEAAEDTSEKDEPVIPVVAATPKEIELEPVYFAFDNFQLTDAGKQQLNKVYALLKEYPVARIRLIGHADASGPAEYNLKLSEKRALTTLNYIKGLGIEMSRMETLAMGEKNFAAINSNPDGTDNPEGRYLNRRVEYEIIGTNDALIFIRMPQIPEHLKFKY